MDFLLRLGHFGNLLRRLEILPQPEIAQAINVAVLAQALLLALLVLGLPLLARHPRGQERARMLPQIVAFSALGLGFLFVEIALIDRAALFLHDRTLAFAFVLTTMLVGSGIGSLLAERLPRSGLGWACGLIALGCVGIALAQQEVIATSGDWPLAARLLLLLLAVGPLAVLMGMPFTLLLSRGGVAGSWFLPWGWGLNGAMSVVATPLANLLALGLGFKPVLLCAAALYGICLLADPTRVRRAVLRSVEPVVEKEFIA